MLLSSRPSPRLFEPRSMATRRCVLSIRWFHHGQWTQIGLRWARRDVDGARAASRRNIQSIQPVRTLHIHTALMPPLIFAGLFVTLWCWKCTMLVLFQNLIIYNPFLPPNARSLRIADYARQCGGVSWQEEAIQSLDGTQLALCVTELCTSTASHEHGAPAYILYMQDISWTLRKVQASNQAIRLTTVCLSYRGYWRSHDRPSEKGINKDTEAALRWIMNLHAERYRNVPTPKPVILLWGQSIGCGLATNLAAATELPVDALILETPFTSARAMLQALYPQKWLPYQYLWPFLRNHLDSWTNLGTMAKRATNRRKPRVYMVEAAKDELVPAGHGESLERRCREVGLPVERLRIRGALHNDASVRAEGKNVIAQSILSAIEAASYDKSLGQADKVPPLDGR